MSSQDTPSRSTARAPAAPRRRVLRRWPAPQPRSRRRSARGAEAVRVRQWQSVAGPPWRPRPPRGGSGRPARGACGTAAGRGSAESHSRHPRKRPNGEVTRARGEGTARAKPPGRLARPARPGREYRTGASAHSALLMRNARDRGAALGRASRHRDRPCARSGYTGYGGGMGRVPHRARLGRVKAPLVGWRRPASAVGTTAVIVAQETVGGRLTTAKWRAPTVGTTGHSTKHVAATLRLLRRGRVWLPMTDGVGERLNICRSVLWPPLGLRLPRLASLVTAAARFGAVSPPAAAPPSTP